VTNGTLPRRARWQDVAYSSRSGPRADRIGAGAAGQGMTDKRTCVRPYCKKRFTPKRPEQQFCSRRCSFKQLRYGKTSDIYWSIADDRGYRVKRLSSLYFVTKS